IADVGFYKGHRIRCPKILYSLQIVVTLKLCGVGYLSQLCALCTLGSDEEKAKLSHLPTSLDEALDALEADHDYLTADGVFPIELLQNFIKTKREECRQMAAIPHPAEFDKYYNL
ncbi:MAG: hypothetical protein IJF78_11015, partial [Clostridia bacterium]|nr:hypothetical protein [Clostridia bacterium]